MRPRRFTKLRDMIDYGGDVLFIRKNRTLLILLYIGKKVFKNLIYAVKEVKRFDRVFLFYFCLLISVQSETFSLELEVFSRIKAVEKKVDLFLNVPFRGT